MSHKRFDFRKLEKAIKTDAGFLKAPVYATRVGVFRYVKADGTVIRELRPAEEVFKKDSMDSLAGVPLTNRHPAEMVTSTNAKKHMIGYTSDKVDQEGKFIKTSVTVTDETTIEEIEKSGLREVSCGYNCELEFTKGVFDGEEYDAIQRNIVYNHLAIVDKGRAGPEVRLRMDADSAILDDETTPTQKKGDSMAKIKLGETEFEVDGGLALAIQTAVKDAEAKGADKAATAEKTATELKTKVDSLEAKKDELESEVKKLKETALDDAKIHARVQERASLLEKAKKYLKSDIDCSKMSDLEIKKAVVLAKHPEVKLDGKSETYVEARYDAIVETKEDGKDNGLKETLSNVDASRGGKDKQETAEEVRARNMKQDSEAWQKPIGTHLN